MMASNRNPKSFFRIFCVTADRAAFESFAALTWSRSGLVRWCLFDHESLEWRQPACSANLTILDCSADQVGAAWKVHSVMRGQYWVVDFSGRGSVPWSRDKRS